MGQIRTLYYIILLLLSITIAFAQEQEPVKVRADAIQMNEIQEHAKVTGNLRAKARAAVASEEEGIIDAVLVDEADEVKKGDVLIRLEDKRLRIAKAQAQAELRATQSMLEAHQAELGNAIWNRDRLKRLFESEMTTEQILQEAEKTAAVSQAQVNSTQRSIEQLKNNIDLLSIRLDDMTIKAPFNGKVVTRHVDLGEWITPGDPIVTLISLGVIEAWLEVPERLKQPVKQYATDIQVNVLEDTFTFQSSRIRAIPEVEPRSRTFYLVVDIMAEEEWLVPGMSVTAWIPAGQTGNYLTVSKDALLRNPTGFYVYKAQPSQAGHVALPINVSVLFNSQGRTVIESAELQKDDLVVIEGNERLMPMTPIEIVNQ